MDWPFPRADWRMTGYHRSVLAKQMRGNEIHRRSISVTRVFDLATVTLTVAFAVLLYRTLSAQAQPLGPKTTNRQRKTGYGLLDLVADSGERCEC